MSFNPRYELKNDAGEILITLRTKINWSRLLQEFHHEAHQELSEEEHLELLLYCIHILRLMQARQTAAAG